MGYPKPFTTQRSMSVAGGWMDDKVVVHFHVESVGGVDFVRLAKDTGLQQVLFGSKKRGVWKDTNLFQHMVNLRNTKVDEAIKQALRVRMIPWLTSPQV